MLAIAQDYEKIAKRAEQRGVPPEPPFPQPFVGGPNGTANKELAGYLRLGES